MKHQVLFSSEDKSKRQDEMSSAAFMLGSLRIENENFPSPPS